VRLRALLLLVVGGIWLGCLPLTARAADVDLPTYIQHLTTAGDALAQAQTLAGAPRDAAIQRARDALTGIDGVSVDGTRYPAPHIDALTALRRSPPDIERAGTQIAEIRALLMDEQTTAPDPQARQKLATVLSDRAFHPAEPNLVQKQATRVQSWIGEQLRRLFRPLARTQPPTAPQGTPGAGPLARFLALLGSPALLILIALLIAATIVALRLRRGRRRTKQTAGDEVMPPRTAAEWRQQADGLAARGEYRAAVRALFLGTLMELDERRLVAFDPALTDREYLREAQRQQSSLIEPLRPFVRLVEAIVYADAPCRAAEYDQARAFTDDVYRRIAAPQGVMA
jgi:hypothetical protein